ncbi:MAG: heme ABC exporter ATP-binding protein CcmA [Rickettsiaceae bacterium]|nr:MAG: heme ABC exporter ATP-binding protein CcmA [Rickettsiaceae bacterium]
MISFERLSCYANGTKLFSNLSFTALPSAIVCITGKNGTGKTSFLRMTAQIQKLNTDGRILFGKNAVNIEMMQRPFCTYIGHNLGLKSELTVLDNLEYWSKIHSSSEALNASICYFNLEHLLNKRCYELSIGNKKKVALSKLLSCQSNLWLLDEADSNLDIENKELLDNLIKAKANNGGIIIMTVHGNSNIATSQKINIEDY